MPTREGGNLVACGGKAAVLHFKFAPWILTALPMLNFGDGFGIAVALS